MTRVLGALLVPVAFALLLVDALSLVEEVPAAVRVLVTPSPLLLAVGIVLLALNLDPVRDRLPWRSRLRFGEPYTDPDKAIVKPAVYYGRIATSASSNSRLIGTPDPPRFYAGREFVPADFLHVSVENASDVDAHGVRVDLSYLGTDGRELFAFPGRWADSPQLAEENVKRRDVSDILDIQAGRALTVDLGFAERGDAHAYAFNTDDTAKYADWKNPKRKLPPATYFVEAHVRAKNAEDLRGWFELIVGGTDMTPTVRRLPRAPAQRRRKARISPS